MMQAKSKQKNALMKRIKESFLGLLECENLDLKDAYRLKEKRVRLHLENYPIELTIGPEAQTLHIYPERPMKQSVKEFQTDHYIIFDPKSYYKGSSGFIRIKDGDELVLGSGRQEQLDLLNLTQTIAHSHLSISNNGGNLVFKNVDKKYSSCISPLLKEKQLNRIRKWRLAMLKRLYTIVDGPIELESPDDALSLIQRANALMEKDPYREKDSKGRPGGVVELPSGVTPLLVGDLHAKADNLLVVLSQGCFLKALKKGSAALIILGDAVHCEDDGKLEEMESSMLIMDLIFHLMLRFPKQVFYLRGNHDSYSIDFGKQGIPQGLLWKKALVKTRGKAYRDEMARFYDLIPYIAYSKNFIACHAGPPTSATSKKQLINIRDYPKLMHELTNNRVRRPNSPSGYFKKEVKKFRKYFNLAADVPVIVGHTPLSCTDTLWERVGKIDNHYVISGCYDEWVGVMAQVGDRIYPFRYQVEPLIPLINKMFK
jgi:hypothetical protein